MIENDESVGKKKRRKEKKEKKSHVTENRNSGEAKQPGGPKGRKRPAVGPTMGT